jgi:DNA primase
MSADTLLARLDGVRATGSGRWIAKCPSHADGHPSLSVRELADGTVLLNCFGGCSGAAVVEAAGLTFSDLFPPRSANHGQRHRLARPAFDALAAFHAVAAEALLVAVLAEDLKAGAALKPADHERLTVAAGRIYRALAAVAEDAKRGRRAA